MSDATNSRKLSKVRLVGKNVSAKVLEEYFPTIDPGILPFGDRVLVQLAKPPEMSSGGIIKPEESVEMDKWRAQVARVVSKGPVAFKDRKTLEDWPEGGWAEAGDYVRVPQYGGDKWEVERNGLKALFVVFQDTDIIGKIDGNPLDHINE